MSTPYPSTLQRPFGQSVAAIADLSTAEGQVLVEIALGPHELERLIREGLPYVGFVCAEWFRLVQSLATETDCRLFQHQILTTNSLKDADFAYRRAVAPALESTLLIDLTNLREERPAGPLS